MSKYDKIRLLEMEINRLINLHMKSIKEELNKYNTKDEKYVKFMTSNDFIYEKRYSLIELVFKKKEVNSEREEYKEVTEFMKDGDDRFMGWGEERLKQIKKHIQENEETLKRYKKLLKNMKKELRELTKE